MDAAHAPLAAQVGLASAYSFFSNKILSCGEGGLLATGSDDVAALARSLRSHAMTSGTWDRHRGHASEYDVAGTGFNYRLDEPRAGAAAGAAAGAERRRGAAAAARAALPVAAGVGAGRLAPVFGGGRRAGSSCYAMPVLVESARDAVRSGNAGSLGACRRACCTRASPV